MAHEIALYARHEVRYTTENPVPVKDVIASLQGLERISTHFLPRTLSALTGAEILGAELFVEGIEEGSLIEQVVVKLFFGSEDKMNAFLEKTHEGPVAKGAAFVTKHPAISAVILALVAAGLVFAYSAMNEGKQAPSIQANNNTVIVIGAEAYKMDPEAFAKVISAAIGPDKKKLAQDAAKVVSPAKNEPNASVELDGHANLSIDSKAVQATPRKVEFDPHHSEHEYKDVNLQIRATDRDSSSRGWAGVIPGLVDRRVKVVLADGVDANEVAKHATVRADVVISYAPPDNKGVYKPNQILVERIISDDDGWLPNVGSE